MGLSYLLLPLRHTKINQSRQLRGYFNSPNQKAEAEEELNGVIKVYHFYIPSIAAKLYIVPNAVLVQCNETRRVANSRNRTLHDTELLKLHLKIDSNLSRQQNSF